MLLTASGTHTRRRCDDLQIGETSMRGLHRCRPKLPPLPLLPPLGQRGCVAPRSAPGIALAVLQPTEELSSKGTFLTCLQRSKSPSQPPPGPAPSVPTSDLGAALPAAACDAERSLNPHAVMHHSCHTASTCIFTAFHLESARRCRQTIRPGRNAGQGARQGASCRLHLRTHSSKPQCCTYS